MDSIYSGVLLQPTVLFDGVRDGRRTQILCQDLDLSVARSITGTGANAAIWVSAAGDSFYVDQDLDNGGSFTVHFQDLQTLVTNRGMKANPGFIANVPFTQILIENAAQPGKYARIFYGVNLDFQPGSSGSTLVAGTVSVVDGAISRTNSGAAFSSYQSLAGVAGQYAHVELWNPGGSGKNLVVKQVRTQVASVNSGLYIEVSNAALATNNGVVISNKLTLGGPNSVAQRRSDSNLAPQAGAFQISAFDFVAGNPPDTYLFTEPLILPPARGLRVRCNAAAAGVTGVFEYYES